MLISHNVAVYRKRAGMSQEDLAERLHVSRQTISKWETGQSLPSAETLMALASALGTPLDFFSSEESHPTQRPKPAGMESLRELYKVGTGPSSSHTMGPSSSQRSRKSAHCG